MIEINKITIEEYNKIFNEYGYTIYRNEVKNSKEKITAIKNGYIYYISLEFLKANEGRARKWHKTNPYSIYNINKWLKENKINTYTIDNEFKTINTKMQWLCKECGNIYIDTFEHIKFKKHGKCQNCGIKMCNNNKIKKYDNIDEIFLNYGLTILEGYGKAHDRIKCITKDGYYVSSNYYNATNNTKQIIFHSLNPYTIENIKHYIDINDLDCELLSTEYTNSKELLKFKCSCGNVYETTLDSFLVNNKTRCNDCTKRTSKGELLVKKWLNNNTIEYIEQYKFDGCRNKRKLPFDFYLPNNNICIEVDGIQHDKIVEFFGGEDRFDYVKKNDNIKNNFCVNNNIKLIRIKYIELQNNTYINKLNKIINT